MGCFHNLAPFPRQLEVDATTVRFVGFFVDESFLNQPVNTLAHRAFGGTKVLRSGDHRVRVSVCTREKRQKLKLRNRERMLRSQAARLGPNEVGDAFENESVGHKQLVATQNLLTSSLKLRINSFDSKRFDSEPRSNDDQADPRRTGSHEKDCVI